MMSGGSLAAALQRVVHRLLEQRAERQKQNDKIPAKQVRRERPPTRRIKPQKEHSDD